MCGYRASRRERHLSRPWHETYDAGSVPAPDGDRAATESEREAVLAALRRHAAADRINVQELVQRTDVAFAAATRSELHAALNGLPQSEARRAARAQRRGAPHRFALLPLVALAAAILILGHGWFLFPLVWFLFVAIRPWGRRYRRPGPPITHW